LGKCKENEGWHQPGKKRSNLGGGCARPWGERTRNSERRRDQRVNEGRRLFVQGKSTRQALSRRFRPSLRATTNRKPQEGKKSTGEENTRGRDGSLKEKAKGGKKRSWGGGGGVRGGAGGWEAKRSHPGRKSQNPDLILERQSHIDALRGGLRRGTLES